MRNDNLTITRGQIGQWASIIGGVALLMGLVGLIWQGGLTEIIIAALGIGAIGIVLWAAMTPQEFRAFISGRQARYSTSAVFGGTFTGWHCGTDVCGFTTCGYCTGYDRRPAL